MKSGIVLVLLAFLPHEIHPLKSETVVGIIKASNLKPPNKVSIGATGPPSDNDMFDIVKNLMRSGFNVQTNGSYNKANSPIVFLPGSVSSFSKTMTLIDTEDLGTNQIVLIIFENDIPGHNIRINQQIYFVNISSMELTEEYNIGGKTVSKTIGKYVKNESEAGQFQLSSTEDLFLDVGKTRGNFFGQYVSAITGHDPPYTYLDRDSIFPGGKKFHGDSTGQLYHVGDNAFGLYIDFFQSLSVSLNFSYDYVAHVNAGNIPWGELDENNNYYGLSLYVTNGTFDVFVAGMSFIPIRQRHLNFLPVVGGKSPAIFIKNSIGEEFNWFMYIRPFSLTLWTVIVLMAVLISSCLHFANNQAQRGFQAKIRLFFGWLWLAMCANFGRRPSDAYKKSLFNRILVSTCLLTGVVVWIAYRASMTSELADVKLKFPFDSLETLLSSDFLLVTEPTYTNTAQLFTKAKKGSIYQKIFQERMLESESFIETTKGLETTSQTDKVAYFIDKQLALAKHPEFDCKIVSAWESMLPLNGFAMATSKKSPYFRALKYQMIKMIENGVAGKKLAADPDCKPLIKTAPSLGFNKMVSLFIWLVLGIILAGVILIIERRVLPPEIVPDTDKEGLVKLNGLLVDSLMFDNVNDIPRIQVSQMLKEVERTTAILSNLLGRK